MTKINKNLMLPIGAFIPILAFTLAIVKTITFDLAISSISLLFSIALIPGVLENFRKKIGWSKQSTIMTCSGLFSMGTMFFAWGGSAMFPTIQVDMRNPHQFHISVIIAYSILLIFYLPVSIIGYVVYGYKVTDNILTILPKNFCIFS